MSITRCISLIDDALLLINSGGKAKLNTMKQMMDEKEFKEESNYIWTSKKIRATFIDYFVGKKHAFISSSPVVPLDDPTLLFTNAGMNQFKPIFLGKISKTDEFAKLKRACNSQKCIRAGGKHNDLDDVGRDTYHHTFFEMLGNWSFGDYFKKEAIDWAWDLLVNVYKLDPNRIYATYFEGNDSVPCDDEALNLWLKYLPKERVLPFDAKDNFWEMGDTGPCGPCTEIHYDRIGNRDASGLVNMDDPNVIEIWNLVFIQFNRKPDKSLELLPNKHVDTGMGFERLTSILQNKKSNYDTDIFENILRGIQTETNVNRGYTGLLGSKDPQGIDMAYRVLADHIRTLTFSIADGAQPGSQGRNSVIRSILRRGIRYGKTKLGAELGFFTKLVDYVVDEMSDFYPEIKKKKDLIKNIIYQEEVRFAKTIDKGELLFARESKKLKQNGKNVVPGDIVFKLYERYGFPPDLSEIMAEEIDMKCDMDEYNQCFDKHREKSKNITGTDDTKIDFGDKERVYLVDVLKINETDDSYKYTWKDISVNCVGLYNAKSKEFVKELNENSFGVMILNNTPYYAESGGQIGDIGYIKSDDNENEFEVTDVQHFGGFVLHIGRVTNGAIKLNSKYSTGVDYDNRRKIAPNHTMTHVLNYGLREVLGGECNQKGSLVDADKTRFDFSHGKALTIDQIVKIENIVNDIIGQELDIFTEEIEYSSIVTVKALRAMFGERYPKTVRVVSIGCKPSDALKAPNDNRWFKFSIELCGGTHLKNTKEAKKFIIISEDALSSGVRRMVAVTYDGAKQAILEANELEQEIDDALLLEGSKLVKECARLNDKFANAYIGYKRKHDLKKKMKKLNAKSLKFKQKASKSLSKNVKDSIKKVIDNLKSDTMFIVQKMDAQVDAKSLKEGIKIWKKNKKSSQKGILLYSLNTNDSNDKNQVIIMAELTKDLVKKGLKAKEWVSNIVNLIDGKGGGNDLKFQCIGSNQSNINDVITKLNKFANDKLS